MSCSSAGDELLFNSVRRAGLAFKSITQDAETRSIGRRHGSMKDLCGARLPRTDLVEIHEFLFYSP